MPKPIRLGVLAAELVALDVACVALHWAARSWHGPVAERLRVMADEMARKASALRKAAYEV